MANALLEVVERRKKMSIDMKIDMKSTSTMWLAGVM
jgi:hypothetical protein